MHLGSQQISSGVCPIQQAWSRYWFVVLCREAYCMLTELVRLLRTYVPPPAPPPPLYYYYYYMI